MNLIETLAKAGISSADIRQDKLQAAENIAALFDSVNEETYKLLRWFESCAGVPEFADGGVSDEPGAGTVSAYYNAAENDLLIDNRDSVFDVRQGGNIEGWLSALSQADRVQFWTGDDRFVHITAHIKNICSTNGGRSHDDE